MTRRTLDRRTFVRTTAALGVTTALAGCGGSGGETGDGGSGGDDGSDGGDDGSAGSDGGDQEFLSEEPEYDGWFDDVGNYEGTVDRTGADEVTVAVGAADGLSFGPAAVAVSPGTTVVWEWTGEGGDHNVSSTAGDFESETVGEEGHTFEHTVEESGVHTYVCTPHEAVGMKGAVYVE
ncbi:halocyanin domain protein [Halorubrum aidingense JCM 13560]|uniref:Halocyanin domain protein n=1 Tax=Halorubrum aidingense JCM 13560 TaxID=1230454 RepID=M0PF40_9EURY|nr:halocyanin domain-containing protein [Halorubrum aidingense]EMA68666.1 halocyanin domain protein [Halorubrum aidingense JCM 13560]